MAEYPIGYMHSFPSEKPIPPEWLPADGSILSVSQYPELYKKIGRMYCTEEDDDTVFRLPDHREKILDPASLDTVDRQFGTVILAIKAKDDKEKCSIPK